MKSIIRITSLLIIIFILSVSCEQKIRRDERIRRIRKPENIILLVGDGMGLTQVSTTFYFKKDGPSHFQRFEYIGLINTSSASHKITDSAAGATAFASGELTYNGAIGVNMDKQPVMNIIEKVSLRKYKTGLIATSSITHATPASFYAHTESRGMHELIAEQLTTSEVDIFMGGGRKFFEDREDGLDMIQKLKDQGFEIHFSLNQSIELDAGKKYGVLVAQDGLPPVHETQDEFLSIATEKTLHYLSASKKPFFLMIEGSQIDWGSHANSNEYTINEMLDFDKTIGKVLDFAEQNRKTLVLVTADHETGGMALAANAGEQKNADYDEILPVFSTGGHTATLIPVFAAGPGAAEFAGIYQITEIYHKMIKLLDLE